MVQPGRWFESDWAWAVFLSLARLALLNLLYFSFLLSLCKVDGIRRLRERCRLSISSGGRAGSARVGPGLAWPGRMMSPALSSAQHASLPLFSGQRQMYGGGNGD